MGCVLTWLLLLLLLDGLLALETTRAVEVAALFVVVLDEDGLLLFGCLI
jgi:hypothetical protein